MAVWAAAWNILQCTWQLPSPTKAQPPIPIVLRLRSSALHRYLVRKVTPNPPQPVGGSDWPQCPRLQAGSPWRSFPLLAPWSLHQAWEPIGAESKFERVLAAALLIFSEGNCCVFTLKWSRVLLVRGADAHFYSKVPASLFHLSRNKVKCQVKERPFWKKALQHIVPSFPCWQEEEALSSSTTLSKNYLLNYFDYLTICLTILTVLLKQLGVRVSRKCSWGEEEDARGKDET